MLPRKKEKSDDDGELCRFCVSTTLQKRDTTTKKGKKRSSKEKEREEKKTNRHFKTLNNTQRRDLEKKTHVLSFKDTKEKRGDVLRWTATRTKAKEEEEERKGMERVTRKKQYRIPRKMSTDTVENRRTKRIAEELTEAIRSTSMGNREEAARQAEADRLAAANRATRGTSEATLARGS